MDGQILLDNKTIVKLAYAFAVATELGKRGEALCPMVRKLLEAVDGVEASPHFVDHKN
jgi:hypothetical protein